MINTVEKIFGNAIAQVTFEIAEEHGLSVMLLGSTGPEDITKEWFEDPSRLKWMTKTNIVHGDEPSVPSPIDFASYKERVDARYSELTYSRLRQAEYPKIEEYIDGIVKGDQAQVDAYIAKCAAVKARYPKTMTHPGNDSLSPDQSRLVD
jgi:hypothetical protein